MDEGSRFPRPFRFVRFRGFIRLAWCKRKVRCVMNKNYLTIFATAALVFATGCVTAGTWVNGCYIDGPLCTVCDGMKVITHAYGTAICTHCDGTGIEPPENETVIVENTVICDTWGPVIAPPPPPPPRPPRWHNHHPRPNVHRNPPRPHHAGGARPPQRSARPAPRPAARPVARPAARPAGGGGRRGGGGRGGRR